MRQAAALVVLILASAASGLSGCGPLGGESDEERATDALTELIEARNRRDFAAVCDLISSRYQLRFQRSGTTCQEALPRLAERGTTTSIVIQEVRVSGDRATVDARVARTGGAGRSQTILLTKEDGEWKVSRVGF
jgi:Domain of unknown function (DUF4878)